jgi:hypothetical protein
MFDGESVDNRTAYESRVKAQITTPDAAHLNDVIGASAKLIGIVAVVLISLIVFVLGYVVQRLLAADEVALLSAVLSSQGKSHREAAVDLAAIEQILPANARVRLVWPKGSLSARKTLLYWASYVNALKCVRPMGKQ